MSKAHAIDPFVPVDKRTNVQALDHIRPYWGLPSRKKGLKITTWQKYLRHATSWDEHTDVTCRSLNIMHLLLPFGSAQSHTCCFSIPRTSLFVDCWRRDDGLHLLFRDLRVIPGEELNNHMLCSTSVAGFHLQYHTRCKESPFGDCFPSKEAAKVLTAHVHCVQGSRRIHARISSAQSHTYTYNFDLGTGTSSNIYARIDMFLLRRLYLCPCMSGSWPSATHRICWSWLTTHFNEGFGVRNVHWERGGLCDQYQSLWLAISMCQFSAVE